MVGKNMQKNKIKVVDNFLFDNEFEKIKNALEGADFPWYWQSHSHTNTVDEKFIGDNVPQLTHCFVDDRKSISDWFNIFLYSSCFLKLNIQIVDKLKANCNYKTINQRVGWFHTDYEDEKKDKMTTSILYINTNNGGTKFEDGTFVNSVSNRMVIFDCSMKHAPVSCTDKHRRIVANLNYFKNE